MLVLLDEARDVVEMLAGAFGFAGEAVDLCDDAALFGQRRKSKMKRFDLRKVDGCMCRTFSKATYIFALSYKCLH
ncbi:hypothetical protein BA190_20005 [Labrys sp. WJW]|nr:hypothetical protein BA190_20005 [Labrys sp. WJW]